MIFEIVFMMVIYFVKQEILNFISKCCQLVLSPINRYKNRRRFKKEMAKLNKAMVNLISVLSEKFAPAMQAAARDIIKFSESMNSLEVKK